MILRNKIKKWKISKFLINNNYYFDRSKVLKHLPGYMLKEAFNKISRWKGYAKTPLISLNKLSNELKLGEIFYKDESKRFHLKSFKNPVHPNLLHRYRLSQVSWLINICASQ